MFALLVTVLVPPTFAAAVETSEAVWINEFHDDNVGTDVNEFIEVAAPSVST